MLREDASSPFCSSGSWLPSLEFLGVQACHSSLCLCSHGCLPFVCVCVQIPLFSQGQQFLKVGTTSPRMASSWLHLPRPDFQIRSCSEVLDGHEFWGAIFIPVHYTICFFNFPLSPGYKAVTSEVCWTLWKRGFRWDEGWRALLGSDAGFHKGLVTCHFRLPSPPPAPSLIFQKTQLLIDSPLVQMEVLVSHGSRKCHGSLVVYGSLVFAVWVL